MSDYSALPRGEYAFPGPLRDALIGVICSGEKTSTTSLAVEYQLEGQPFPQVGEREVIIDSHGRDVAVTENTAVRLCRLDEVTCEHALAEGEGFADVADWRARHEEFWHSPAFREALGDSGFTVDDSTLVVCVSFRVIDLL